jgi:hypothetical protein
MESRLHGFLDVLCRGARRHRSIVSFGAAVGGFRRPIIVDGRFRGCRCRFAILLASVGQSVARRLLLSRARFALFCCHCPPLVGFAADRGLQGPDRSTRSNSLRLIRVTQRALLLLSLLALLLDFRPDPARLFDGRDCAFDDVRRCLAESLDSGARDYRRRKTRKWLLRHSGLSRRPVQRAQSSGRARSPH